MLPSNVVRLISEYSKPCTRPEWRTLRKITNYDLYIIIMKSDVTSKLLTIIHTNMTHSMWYELFSYTEIWGLNRTSKCFKIPEKDLLKIDGIYRASLIHKYRNEK